jgi:mevalonate kinase
MIRQPINSTTLKEKFSKLYEEIFSPSALVVSAPGSFFWTGEHAVGLGGCAITSKIPLRCYVGFEPIAEKGKVYISSYCISAPSKEKFKDIETYTERDLTFENRLINFLEQSIAQSTNQKDFPGIALHILSEIPIGCGLNSSGALASTIAFGIGLFYQKITTVKLHQWQKMPLIKLIDDPQFRVFLQLSTEIEKIFHETNSPDITCLSPLLDSEGPLVFLMSVDSRKKIKYFPFRIEEIFQVKKPFSLPLDYGLIFSGHIRNTKDIITSINEIKKSFDHFSDFFQQTFPILNILPSSPQPSLFPTLAKNQYSSPFFDQINQGGNQGWMLYSGPLLVLSFQTLAQFKELLEEGYSETRLKKLISLINLYQDGLRLLGVSNETLDFICADFKQQASAIRGSQMGVKITGGGKGGDVLFVTAFGDLRYTFGEMLDNLKTKIGRNIFLDYASWIDGNEIRGLRVEQFLTEGLYSSFTSPGTFTLTVYDQQGQSFSRVFGLETLKEEMANIDLLIHLGEEKIYVRGEKLNSKEIPSSKAAILMLQTLLANLNRGVPNQNLPQGGYSSDRNSIQSKIISPLQKAIQI